ncbi:hypothetical protein RHMOL_Rhmol06G0193600 [Rhododendron molle]|uniref:Uncharacterized protein n=1 Tax=Rhododendron molle TaxID=49168 RepID=A0ACC0NF48_RHOML|nr:hypothetical protein RHMOL_Rhmol06G0193600 [Rhododendron molle]
MASSRSTNNKYASLNFNDIHQKKHHPSSSSSASPLTTPTSKKILSNSRIHGNMLVLTRPAPKPVPQPSPPSTPPQPQLQQSPTTPDPISLRPLGRTGSGPTLIPSPLTLPKPDREYSPSPSPSPKSGRFVPPHLRPGFAGREEKPGLQQGARSRENLVEMNRPGSSGTRPSSSGRWWLDIADKKRKKGWLHANYVTDEAGPNQLIMEQEFLAKP